MKKTFGQKLKQARLAKGLTLEQLADIVGSTKAYIWQMENKESARPSAILLFKIADAIEEDPEYLASEASSKPSEVQEEKAFFRKFQNLTEKDKDVIMRMVKGLDPQKK